MRCGWVTVRWGWDETQSWESDWSTQLNPTQTNPTQFKATNLITSPNLRRSLLQLDSAKLFIVSGRTGDVITQSYSSTQQNSCVELSSVVRSDQSFTWLWHETREPNLVPKISVKAEKYYKLAVVNSMNNYTKYEQVMESIQTAPSRWSSGSTEKYLCPTCTLRVQGKGRSS